MKFLVFAAIVDFLIFAIVVAIGVFVLLKNSKRKTNIFFAATVFSLALWVFTASASDLSPNNNIALFWLRLAIVGPFFFASAFYCFTLFFPKQSRKVSKWEIAFVFLPALLILPLVPTSFNVKSATLQSWGADFEGGLLYIVLLFYLIAFLGGGFYNLAKNYRSSPVNRMQIKYVLAAVFVLFLLGATSNLILPVFFGIGNFSSLGPSIALLIFSIIIAYAILAHHLLDIAVVIRLGTVFGTLFTIIAAFYFFATSLLSRFFTGTISILATLLPAFVIVLTYSPLKKAIESLTDRIFFQKRYRFSDVVNSFGEKVHAAGPDLREVLRVFNDTITSALKVNNSAVALIPATKEFIFLEQAVVARNINFLRLPADSSFLKYFKLKPHTILEKEELRRILESEDSKNNAIEKSVLAELEKTGFDIALPIELKERIAFIYLVGAKKSNDVFYSDDIRLLYHAANEIAPFIDNAGLYEDLRVTSEAKSRFISVVSHQLRTPISVIRWSLEMAREKDSAPKDKETYLDNSYQGAIFLGEQLDDILIALDIYDKKLFIKKDKCNIQEIAKELVPEFTPLIRSKKINIHYHINDDANFVQGDYNKLKKVIKILFKNALIYSRSGGNVNIGARLDEQGKGKRYIITISDEGIGISESERDHIFEEFFRSDQARTILPDGLGLGIFIARAFIIAHGGEIWFYSQGRDKGADFHFSLPAE